MLVLVYGLKNEEYYIWSVLVLLSDSQNEEYYIRSALNDSKIGANLAGQNDRLPFYLVESTIQRLNKQDLLDSSKSPVFSRSSRSSTYRHGRASWFQIVVAKKNPPCTTINPMVHLKTRWQHLTVSAWSGQLNGKIGNCKQSKDLLSALSCGQPNNH